MLPPLAEKHDEAVLVVWHCIHKLGNDLQHALNAGLILPNTGKEGVGVGATMRGAFAERSQQMVQAHGIDEHRTVRNLRHPPTELIVVTSILAVPT